MPRERHIRTYVDRWPSGVLGEVEVRTHTLVYSVRTPEGEAIWSRTVKIRPGGSRWRNAALSAAREQDRIAGQEDLQRTRA